MHAVRFSSVLRRSRSAVPHAVGMLRRATVGTRKKPCTVQAGAASPSVAIRSASATLAQPATSARAPPAASGSALTSTDVGDAAASPRAQLSGPELVRAYMELSKAKLNALVVITSGVGYIMGSGGVPLNLTHLFLSTAGTAACAGAAGALNQIYEVENDALMKRTRKRPLPAAVAAATGTTTLALACNPLAAALGALNIVLYAGIYTPLKQRSHWNTWIGAIVGAVPPVIGWVCATGAIDPGALVLGGALFAWQMPHFMALAWMYRQDYEAAGYRMLSMTKPQNVPLVALRHSLYLAPVGLLAAHFNMTQSPWFEIESTVLSAYIVYLAVKFYRNKTNANARRLFLGSLAYLPLLMGFLVIHRKSDAGADLETEALSSPLPSTQRVESGSAAHDAGARAPPCLFTRARDALADAPFPLLPMPVPSSERRSSQSKE